MDGTELNPFCVRVNDFEPTYTEQGQPVNYAADIRYQSGEDLASGTWRDYRLEVNSPLRTAGDRVYLLGHGYAPTFTVTWPNGESRTQTIQWRPTDQNTMLSQGATKFDPPGITDSRTRRENQLAVTGLFAPTAVFHGNILTSSFPDLTEPAVAVDIMRGELGMDSGRAQSIFEIDQSMVDSGRLERVARENLRLGESITLDDGTRISFDGVRRWVSLQVSHDPTQGWVLGFAIAMFVGLGASLAVKRRRFWARVTPLDTDGDSPAEARDVRRSVGRVGRARPYRSGRLRRGVHRHLAGPPRPHATGLEKGMQMPVNETLSQYSDWSYTTSVVVYLLAMISFLVEQSFGKHGTRAAERSRARQLVGVGAGAGSDSGDTTSDVAEGTSTGRAPRTRTERIGRMGVALTILAAALHLAALVLRGLATSRVPWGNMYEYIMAITFVGVVTWLVLLRKYPLRHLSAFVLLPVVILMFVGGTMLYAVAAPLQPALQSYWLVIHVAAAAASSGVFLVPGRGQHPVPHPLGP